MFFFNLSIISSPFQIPIYITVLMLPDIVFQILQTRLVVLDKRLRVFSIGKADNPCLNCALQSFIYAAYPPG